VWQQTFLPQTRAAGPRVDLAREKSLVDALQSLHQQHLVRSAHDLSNGGLAVALAECAIGAYGCHVELGGHADDLDAVGLLFSESQARAVVSCSPSLTRNVLRECETRGLEARRIGRTETATFLIERAGVPLVRTSTEGLARIWESAFPKLLAGDSIEEILRGSGETADIIAP
jgi:phosphoribosylformylglycinamidine synthase subunit PurL